MWLGPSEWKTHLAPAKGENAVIMPILVGLIFQFISGVALALVWYPPAKDRLSGHIIVGSTTATLSEWKAISTYMSANFTAGTVQS